MEPFAPWFICAIRLGHLKMKATKVVFSLNEARLPDERSKKNAALAAFNLNGGADGRDRTCDLLVTNELLYQLSYIGTPCCQY